MEDELELDRRALELGALPHAPMDMPVQVLETPTMQAVMQAGGVLPFVLRQIMAPWQAAKAGH
ncbi:hypothetical protein [Neogemmobacter tilapiae]|nr:hypothetical protein [Gemmobacter tilapiae]